MEKKIFRRFILIGLLAILLTAAATLILYASALERQTFADLRRITDTAAAACEISGAEAALPRLADDALRLTLVAGDGSVLWDSETDAGRMENHGQRPEILQALADGSGESVRRSVTLGEDTYYSAVRLQDGTVLRAAQRISAVYALFRRAALVVGLLLLLLVPAAAFLSWLLTRSIVRPIREMAGNLDEIEENVPYEELRPFALAVRDWQREKRQNERMRQEFTANVSHELKTPLTSISGYAEMIANGMARKEDVKGFAGKVRDEAGRLITLIGDIIKLNELDEPPRREDFAPVDLLDAAQGVAELLALNAKRADIRLTVGGVRALVWGERGMLDELIYNLCDNAIRYNRAGGSVAVMVVREGDRVILRVRDTGIGIPQEHQERIFERFYRVDKSRSKETGGTGLGLAIVKHVAMRHQARIHVESAVGQGTEIEVSFRMYSEGAETAAGQE